MAITERYVTTTGTDTWANATNIATPASWATMLTNAVAGDRVNVKSGTYSQTTTVDALSSSGTATSPIIIRGYASSIGDYYLGRTTGGWTLTTTNMPFISYTSGRFNVTGTFVLLEGIRVGATSSTSTAVTLTSDSAMIRCSITHTGTAAGAIVVSGNLRSVLYDCDLFLDGASGGTAATTLLSANSTVDSCLITAKSSTANGINAASSSTIYGCRILGQGTGGGQHGIAMTITSGSPFIRNNTIRLWGGDAINIITGTTVLQKIIGNMITDNTGDGIDMVSTSNCAIAACNRTRDNANGYNNAGDWLTGTKYGDVTTDTGGPETDYTDATNHDHSLIFASPATNVNIPISASIGALQRASISGQTSKIG